MNHTLVAFLFSLLIVVSCTQTTQEEPESTAKTIDTIETDATYYYQIPETPENYTAGSVAARVVDGLGFRFFHATADLTEENLTFRPSEQARTLDETLDHILSLTRITRNAVMGQASDFSIEHPVLTYDKKRLKILENIRVISEILKNSSEEDLASFPIIFLYQDGNKREYPFWNLLNGPIADAIWHTGQVVTFRRSAGNPFNSKASVLSGKVRED